MVWIPLDPPESIRETFINSCVKKYRNNPLTDLQCIYVPSKEIFENWHEQMPKNFPEKKAENYFEGSAYQKQFQDLYSSRIAVYSDEIIFQYLHELPKPVTRSKCCCLSNRESDMQIEFKSEELYFFGPGLDRQDYSRDNYPQTSEVPGIVTFWADWHARRIFVIEEVGILMHKALFK
eukprot:snap_masked-scaffold_30-processed-gene-0.37-mRNA-1 protein AED:1.00 eAED:1.00 QI:0/0/0/0/1/1/2/0/177